MEKRKRLARVENLQLSSRQNDILVGLLLGDAHLGINGKKTRLIYSQGGNGRIGDSHEKYLFNVYDDFEEWCLSRPQKILRKFSIKQNKIETYKLHRFQTVTHDAFSDLFHLFYKEHPKSFKNSKLLRQDALSLNLRKNDKKDFFYRKTVPDSIQELLSARALAYWYMDDGSIKYKKSGGCILNTQSFTFDECLLLCSALSKNFDLDAQIRDKKRSDFLFGHQIYISTRFAKILDCFTCDYLEEMRYKLPKRTRVYNR